LISFIKHNVSESGARTDINSVQQTLMITFPTQAHLMTETDLVSFQNVVLYNAAADDDKTEDDGKCP
jgi:hypothetical protein